MPYWFDSGLVDKPPKLEGLQDRRRKLTDADRERIVSLRKQGRGVREIARLYPQVTRRTIQFILDPSRIQRSRGDRTWRDYYNREYQRKATAKTRNHRRDVFGLRTPRPVEDTRTNQGKENNAKV